VELLKKRQEAVLQAKKVASSLASRCPLCISAFPHAGAPLLFQHAQAALREQDKKRPKAKAAAAAENSDDEDDEDDAEAWETMGWRSKAL
jgi:hypothetical protein